MTDLARSLLDLARWAPSGDNVQCWRFEIVGERHVVVHGFDTRDHVVYDLDGSASQLSLGALLETIAIAATGFGCQARIVRRTGLPDTTPTFDVHLEAAPDMPRDAFFDSIRHRTVQRRPMPTTPLSAEAKRAMQGALPAGYEVQWIEPFSQRLKVAVNLYRNARIRLEMPEAYPVHRDVIEWGVRFSETRLPDQALGVGAPTLAVMRFGMHSWQRLRFLNRYFAGTVMPRLQMDLAPALACAAHLVIKAPAEPKTVDDHVAAGRAVQRLWLQATALGLHEQPEMTPLLFARFVRDGRRFTQVGSLQAAAAEMTGRWAALIGADLPRAVWMARIGAGPAATARSIRRPLDELLQPITR
jgi:hypothetical protein